MVQFLPTDRSFLYLASKLADPFCVAYQALRYRLLMPFDHFGKDNHYVDLAKRASILAISSLAAIVGLSFPISTLTFISSLGFGYLSCRAIGFAIQKEGYTHVTLNAPEKVVNNLKIMSWNLCGVAAGFPYEFGGVLPWKDRLPAIVDSIQRADPDILVIQEEYDSELGEALIDKLKNNFSHAYLHLGKSVGGVGSGVMIFSKCKADNFSYENFKNCGYFNKRGFATLEIKTKDNQPVRIIGTHLAYKGLSRPIEEIRQEELLQMFDGLNDKTEIPTILAADTNIERSSTAIDRKYLENFIDQEYVDEEPTCSDNFKAMWRDEPQDMNKMRTIDHVTLLKTKDSESWNNIQMIYDKSIKAFHSNSEPYEALSDHQPIIATMNFLS